MVLTEITHKGSRFMMGDPGCPYAARPRRSAHLGVKLPARVEVVVVRREPRVLELSRLLLVQHAQRGAHLQSHAIDLSDHVEDVGEGILLVAQLPPGGAHAEASAARLLGPPRRLHHLRHLHLWRRLHMRLVPHRL